MTLSPRSIWLLLALGACDVLGGGGGQDTADPTPWEAGELPTELALVRPAPPSPVVYEVRGDGHALWASGHDGRLHRKFAADGPWEALPGGSGHFGLLDDGGALLLDQGGPFGAEEPVLMRIAPDGTRSPLPFTLDYADDFDAPDARWTGMRFFEDGSRLWAAAIGWLDEVDYTLAPRRLFYTDDAGDTLVEVTLPQPLADSSGIRVTAGGGVRVVTTYDLSEGAWWLDDDDHAEPIPLPADAVDAVVAPSGELVVATGAAGGHAVHRGQLADGVWTFSATELAEPVRLSAAGDSVWAVSVDPEDGARYVGQRLYRSDDGGQTWAQLVNGGQRLSAAFATGLAAGPDGIYSRDGSFVAVLDEAAGRWRLDGLPDRPVRLADASGARVAAVLDTSPDDVYGIQPTLFLSDDLGVSWSYIGDLPFAPRCLSVSLGGAALGGRFDDAGAPWRLYDGDFVLLDEGRVSVEGAYDVRGPMRACVLQGGGASATITAGVGPDEVLPDVYVRWNRSSGRRSWDVLPHPFAPEGRITSLQGGVVHGERLSLAGAGYQRSPQEANLGGGGATGDFGAPNGGPGAIGRAGYYRLYPGGDAGGAQIRTHGGRPVTLLGDGAGLEPTAIAVTADEQLWVGTDAGLLRTEVPPRPW